MKNSRDDLFRQESLERLSSPERLDQLMQVVAPKDWLGLVALVFLLMLGLGWSIWGKIPIIVASRGVLIYPNGIISLQAPSSGILKNWRVKVGDTIHPGDVLGILDQDSQIISQYEGQVLEITAQPGQVINRSDQLGVIQVKSTTAKLVGLSYFSIKDGKQIQPNMTVQITPDTVKQEQFGGMLGKVQSISSFPVTQQSMISMIGNAEIAKSLMIEGGQIQVLVALQPNPTTFSGYQWSSAQGPKLSISAGTTASIRVRVGTQAPITFVLPTLKSLTGID
jgi:multidrug efflux pump subunit AcrA (membrane-fusion protein)